MRVNKANLQKIRLSTMCLSIARGSLRTPLWWTTSTWTSSKKTQFLTYKKWNRLRTKFWKFQQLLVKRIIIFLRILTARKGINSIFNHLTIRNKALIFKTLRTSSYLKYTKLRKEVSKITWRTDLTRSKFKKTRPRNEKICLFQIVLRHLQIRANL